MNLVLRSLNVIHIKEDEEMSCELPLEANPFLDIFKECSTSESDCTALD